jgi:hypothetical protein
VEALIYIVDLTSSDVASKAMRRPAWASSSCVGELGQPKSGSKMLVVALRHHAERLPPIELKLSNVRPTSNWRRDEIYHDDGR